MWSTSENQRAVPESITPIEAGAVFSRVGAFVRTGEDPGGTGHAVSVASVTIRLRGERVGEGLAWGVDDPVGEAMRAARTGAVRRGGDDPEAWSIELELGGAWTPRAAHTWGELGASAKPGVRGVAARLGVGDGQREAVLTPGRQLRYGMGPLGVWRRVGAQVGAPLGLLADVVEQTGVRFYTFECARVAQRDAGSALMFLHRLGDIEPLSEVTTPGLQEQTRLMARFLSAQRMTGMRALGMSGDLHLWSGMHEPEIAPLRTQMGAALALARYARTGGVDPETLAIAREASADILVDALVVEPGETLFVDDPVAAAGFLVAAGELSRSGALRGDITDALERTRSLVAGFGWSPEGARVESDVAALVALALIRDHADLGGPERHREVGATLARALVTELGGEEAHTAMPWLAWALVESSEGDERVVGDVALRATRDRAERLQASDLLLDPEDRDLVGGFLWAEDPGAYPDWRSARIGAMLGLMLGDARLTEPEERVRRLDRVRRSARFLRQLVVDGQTLWLTPASLDAIGGVREVVWGDSASVEATAIALIALCETLDGVRDAFGD
ncbi:MAG: hypothetical protein Tsb0013_04800 [Phycisphaerales bacterium]